MHGRKSGLYLHLKEETCDTNDTTYHNTTKSGPPIRLLPIAVSIDIILVPYSSKRSPPSELCLRAAISLSLSRGADRTEWCDNMKTSHPSGVALNQSSAREQE